MQLLVSHIRLRKIAIIRQNKNGNVVVSSIKYIMKSANMKDILSVLSSHVCHDIYIYLLTYLYLYILLRFITPFLRKAT